MKFLLSLLFVIQTVLPAWAGPTKVIQADKVSGIDASKNYLSQGDAELKITGINQYNDGDVARPIDCGGGSGSVTMARSSSSPIEDNWSWILTKGSGSMRGQGVSIDFTAPSVKAMTVAARYLINSGSFTAGTPAPNLTDSDLIFYIYDITNAKLIEPSTFNLYSNATTFDSPYSGDFQTSAGSTSYRLCLHVATTNSSAWSLKLDEITVRISRYASGTTSTDTTTYVGSLSYGGTAATNIASQTYKQAKVGDKLFVSGTILFNGPANGNGAFRIPLPPGLSTDTTKIPSSYAKVGDAIGYFNSNKQFDGHIRIDGNSTTYVTIHRWDDSGAADQDWGGNTSGASNVPGGVAIANGDGLSFTFTVPILGWSSSVQQSDGYEGRQIVASGSFSTTTISTTFSQLGITAPRDASGMVSGNSVVIQSDADYAIDMFLSANSASSSTTDQEAAIYVNGLSVKSSVVTSQYWHSNSVHYEARLKAGDIVTFYAGHGVVTATTSATRNSWSVKRLAGNPVISATETVGALYTGTPPTGTLTNVANTATFGTKVKDSHGAYSGGEYTVPVSGQYDISSQVLITGNYSAGNANYIGIYIDGVEKYTSMHRTTATVTGYNFVTKIDVKSIPILAGQKITIKVSTEGTSTSYVSLSAYNFFSISRSGGY